MFAVTFRLDLNRSEQGIYSVTFQVRAGSYQEAIAQAFRLLETLWQAEHRIVPDVRMVNVCYSGNF